MRQAQPLRRRWSAGDRQQRYRECHPPVRPRKKTWLFGDSIKGVKAGVLLCWYRDHQSERTIILCRSPIPVHGTAESKPLTLSKHGRLVTSTRIRSGPVNQMRASISAYTETIQSEGSPTHPLQTNRRVCAPTSDSPCRAISRYALSANSCRSDTSQLVPVASLPTGIA